MSPDDGQTVGAGPGANPDAPADPQTGGAAGQQGNESGQTNGGAQGPPSPFALPTSPLDLPTTVVEADDPKIKEPSLPIIGFKLSKFVLIIISGFILFLIIYLSVKQFDASSLIKIPTEAAASDSTYARQIEVIRMLQEEKKSYREFTVQMSQMVLLNLLLPVLTAILGYIFASNKDNTSSGEA